MHSILIIGLDLKKNVIIAHDPVGDYNSNYLIWYGACIEIDIEEYRSISTGDPFTLILNVPNKIFLKKIKKILNNVKIFVYP